MKLKIYTDGGYSRKSELGKWAYIVTKDEEEIDRLVTLEEDSTSNRMELTALLGALEYAANNPENSYTILSDSQYAVNGFNLWLGTWAKNNWTKAGGIDVKNSDLWEKIFYYYELNTPVIDVVWVRGHNGNKFNELVDSLVNMGQDDVKAKPKKTPRKPRKKKEPVKVKSVYDDGNDVIIDLEKNVSYVLKVGEDVTMEEKIEFDFPKEYQLVDKMLQAIITVGKKYKNSVKIYCNLPYIVEDYYYRKRYKNTPLNENLYSNDFLWSELVKMPKLNLKDYREYIMDKKGIPKEYRISEFTN